MTALITQSRVMFAVSLVATLLIYFCITLYLAQVQVAPLQPGAYNSYTCTTRDQRVAEQFRILTLTPFQAREIAESVCSIGGEFGIGSVEISWESRAFLTPDDIVDGRYDLFWNRQHLVEGMVPSLLQYFQPLLDTPRYSLYWLTLDSNPVPDAAYFSDKSVGLLALSESQTFYQQPFAWLRNRDIELRDAQLRYYASLDSLFSAFAAGEVDLISAAPAMTKGLDIAPVQRMLINDEMESGTWFLRQQWNDSQLSCELIAVLKANALFPLFQDDYPNFIERTLCN